MYSVIIRPLHLVRILIASGNPTMEKHTADTVLYSSPNNFVLHMLDRDMNLMGIITPEQR